MFGSPNQLSGSPTVPGRPIDPALGLPRAVVREQRWVVWLELLVVVLMAAILFAMTRAQLAGEVVKGNFWLTAAICVGGGGYALFDARRRVARKSCVIVAQNGFDIRVGTNPTGPVLWSEVESISTERDVKVGVGGRWLVHARAVNTIVIRLGGEPSAPLSSMGAPVRQNKVLRIDLEEMEGGRRRLPELMDESLARWRVDQAYEQGWAASPSGASWEVPQPRSWAQSHGTPGSDQWGAPPGRVFDSVFGFWNHGSTGSAVPFAPTPGAVWSDMASRIGAFAIDIGIVVVEGFMVVMFVEGNYGPDTPETAAATFSWMLMLLLYQPICWLLFGGSIGHLLLGLRVVRAVDGRRIGLGRTIHRYLVWAIGVPLVLFGLADTAVKDDPRPHTWWDRAAGTAVIRRSRGPAWARWLALLIAVPVAVGGFWGFGVYQAKLDGAAAASPSASAASSPVASPIVSAPAASDAPASAPRPSISSASADPT
jgi:hypothetical protein